MSAELSERLAKLEVLATEKQLQLKQEILDLKEHVKGLEDVIHLTLDKNNTEQTILINQILKDVASIAGDVSKYKGLVGGAIFAVSGLWFVLSQVASWLHLDFIKLLSSALGK